MEVVLPSLRQGGRGPRRQFRDAQPRAQARPAIAVRRRLAPLANPRVQFARGLACEQQHGLIRQVHHGFHDLELLLEQRHIVGRFLEIGNADALAGGRLRHLAPDVFQGPGVGAVRGRSHAQQVEVVDMLRHPRRVAADDLEVLSHLRHDPVPPANRFDDVGEQNAPEEEGDDEVRRPEDGGEHQECDDGDHDRVSRSARFHGSRLSPARRSPPATATRGLRIGIGAPAHEPRSVWLRQVSSSDFSCISSRSATDADVK